MSEQENKTKTLELVIEKLHITAWGEACEQEKRYLVPFVLPGERVRVGVVGRKKGFYLCELQDLLQAHDKRVLPVCSLFGICGGCQLQHVAYDDQLHLKQGWVEETFRKNKVSLPEQLNKIVPSLSPYHYRNRITLHGSHNKIGFYKPESHEVVVVKSCCIATERINQKIQEVYEAKEYFESRELREDDRSGFIQVNTFQNQTLIDLVLKHTQGKKWKRVLDLYCGSGNFTMPLSQVSRHVVGVEMDQAAVVLANQLRLQQQNKKIKFECRDVLDFVFAEAEDFQTYDLIVCDPPREGLGQAARYLLRLKPEKIIFVSCHLGNFMKDAKILCDGGFVLKELTPVDMFPQTHHIEVVGVFENS